jgi:hypothetical protein
MALVFMDGFDKYGGVNSNATVVQALLQQGEWTSVTTNLGISAGLSATGYSLNFVTQNNAAAKTLAASYNRLIGGFRFNSNLGNPGGIQLNDAGTGQVSVVVNAATGTISVKNGLLGSGTVLGTSTASVSAGTTHYLEFDITIGNANNYQVWLDGVSILSGTGDTQATANSTVNGFSVAIGTGGSPIFQMDDLYIFDATGTTNNAPLLTSPRIETQFPTGDAAVQFAIGAATLGNGVARGGTNYTGGANTLYVRPYTPARNCTLNSISLQAAQTNGTVNLRPVVYADNAGVPNGGALLSGGATVTGQTSGIIMTLPLTTPVALTAGTQYWLGFMQDAGSANMTAQDASALGRFVAATFASGAPATCPTTTGSQVSVVVYGNITNTGVNWYEVASQPPQGAPSYVYDATVGHEDLYSFPSLSVPPTAIYAVAVKASLSKSDAGAKTASVRLKSAATDSAGTGGTALAPGTSYAWMTSLFERDPNGNIAWTQPNLNAAQAGVKVET